MLVLSRKLGERIVIGHNIVVTVVDVQGDRVKLGFTAPHDIPIFREEIVGRPLAHAPRETEMETAASPFFAECA